VDVKIQQGRRGSFEVSVDGELLHSKLATGEWPDPEKIREAVAARLAG
jgi:selT/selW/selH-like putative selenoprotein